MLQIRQYTADDRPVVEAWVKEFDQNWTLDNVPGLGWVVGDEFGDIAAGWLVQTDSKFAVLEGFCVNKHAPGLARHEALNLLVDQTEAAAKELGFTRILAYLQHDGLLKRAIDSGFKDVCRCAMIVKDI